MKKQTLICLGIALFSIISCTKETIDGSGVIISESRTVNSFNKVSSEGIFEVNITNGTDQFIEITTDNNIMPHVVTKVVNSELQLYLDNDKNYRNLSIQVTIGASNLSGLKNEGTGNMDISDVQVDNFSIYNSGTGNIQIDGSASNLDILNEGTGNVSGFNFLVQNCNVKIEGSGNLEISCSNNLDVIIEGSGDVLYLGEPSIETNITGSGSVIKAN